IAFDLITAERALDSVGHHPAFGFNFDPSHLLWQGVDPVRFIERFGDRIHHTHMKDVAVRQSGKSGILGSCLHCGAPRRGWDFRSVGRGDIDFAEIIRARNRAGYKGPLWVEWEDMAMNREHGAYESCQYVRQVEFTASNQAFDEAFIKDR